MGSSFIRKSRQIKPWTVGRSCDRLRFTTDRNEREEKTNDGNLKKKKKEEEEWRNKTLKKYRRVQRGVERQVKNRIDDSLSLAMGDLLVLRTNQNWNAGKFGKCEETYSVRVL